MFAARGETCSTMRSTPVTWDLKSLKSLPPSLGLSPSHFVPGCVQHSEKKLGDGDAAHALLAALIALTNLKLLPYPQSSETQNEDLENVVKLVSAEI